MRRNKNTIKEMGLDARVRRAASKIGFRVHKSRARESLDNFGGYMLVDNHTNGVVDGARFDMTAQEVFDRCKDEARLSKQEG